MATSTRSKRSQPSTPAPRAKQSRRYAVVYDIEGPRVRLGILWFLIALAGMVVAPPLTVAVVYGLVAAVAAAQVATVWRREGNRAAVPVAAAGAGGMAVGALLGAGGMGLVMAGTAVAACVVAAGDTRSRAPLFSDAGWTVLSAIPPGLAAGSMVLLARLEIGAALALLALVSAYEIGDYLIGSGARNRFEGPVAGLLAVVVITFIIAILQVPPFESESGWAYGIAAGLLCPLGQLLASALLPDAGSPASGLRRIDSLLLAAPAWVWGVGLLLESQM